MVNQTQFLMPNIIQKIVNSVILLLKNSFMKQSK